VKTLRVGVIDGEQTRGVFWVKVDARDIYCGVKGVSYHSSYHDSGEIHITRQASPQVEPPAAGFTCYHGINEPFRVSRPNQLRGSVLLGCAALPTDEASLEDFEVIGNKKYDGIVYVDTRLFGNAIGIRAWASRPNYFFERMPQPPGFRTIFDLQLCWIVVDVENG